MEIFRTIVKNIGSEANAFKEDNMLILFGENAPDTLRDYCYTIEVHPSTAEIQTGMTLQVGHQPYKITSVGNKVKKNLDSLGHITINFNGSKEADLPGTLYVERKNYPILTIGTTLSIFKDL